MLTAKTHKPFSDLHNTEFRQICTSTDSPSSDIKYQLNQIPGPMLELSYIFKSLDEFPKIVKDKIIPS